MVKIPPNLHLLVKDRYNAAVNGSVIFSETKLAVIRVNNVPFQLRYCPALSAKPKTSPSDAPKKSKTFDPFDNPPADLLIADLPPSHLLVLNKYPVIPEHFILATKEFKEQTQLLEEEDLSAAYACVKSWKSRGKELFGFFNSGEHSGASQRHRHLQFLDVEAMAGNEEKEGWEVLADTLANSSAAALPLAVFTARLPETDLSSDSLFQTYKTLHQKATAVVNSHHGKLHDALDSSSSISYNLGITHKSLVICPRRAEAGRLSDDDSAEQPALNGTVLAGTLMVKSEEAYNFLRTQPEKLADVLKDIGFPPLNDLHRKL